MLTDNQDSERTIKANVKQTIGDILSNYYGRYFTYANLDDLYVKLSSELDSGADVKLTLTRTEDDRVSVSVTHSGVVYTASIPVTCVAAKRVQS